MQPITYVKKTIYGTDMLYIIGEAAPHIQKLTGKKTVTEADLKALESLGLTTEYVPQ